MFRTFSDQIRGRTCETLFLPVPLNKTLHASVCCGMMEGSTPLSDQRGADGVLKFVGYDCSKAAARKKLFSLMIAVTLPAGTPYTLVRWYEFSSGDNRAIGTASQHLLNLVEATQQIGVRAC